MKTFKKTFLFMRHGETDWNKQGLFQGQNDIPMNESGIIQIQNSANENIDQLKTVDHIFYSPLKRTVQTANIVSTFIPHVPKSAIQEIIPCNCIATSQYILKSKGVTNMPSFEKINDDGENITAFLGRIESGLQKILSAPYNTPLIVSHGEVHTGICLVLNTAPYLTPNGSITQFQIH